MSRIVIPNTGAGFSNPTEDLVGFQSVRGGGLTNTNFRFDTGLYTIYDSENRIYKQYNLYEIRSDFNDLLYEVRQDRGNNIDFTVSFDNIIP